MSDARTAQPAALLRTSRSISQDASCTHQTRHRHSTAQVRGQEGTTTQGGGEQHGQESRDCGGDVQHAGTAHRWLLPKYCWVHRQCRHEFGAFRGGTPCNMRCVPQKGGRKPWSSWRKIEADSVLMVVRDTSTPPCVCTSPCCYSLHSTHCVPFAAVSHTHHVLYKHVLWLREGQRCKYPVFSLHSPSPHTRV